MLTTYAARVTKMFTVYFSNISIIESGVNCSCSCSLAVLDPRVGHTMDILSPFIPVLCHSD